MFQVTSDAPLHSQDMYLAQVHQTKPLSDKNERVALQSWHNDKTAWERLVEAYQPLVLNVARRYYRPDCGMELMDLVQEGNLGLLQGIEKYRPLEGDQEARFSTYAFTCIRGAITEALWQNSGIIRLPSQKVRALRRLDQVEAQLCVTKGRTPTHQEIAQAMQIDFPALRELLLLRMQQVVKLDTMLSDDHSIADVVGEVLQSPQGAAQWIHEAIASLPHWEKTILKARFGEDGSLTISRKDVADQLGMTPQQVERIETRARRLIKQYIAHAAT